MALPTKTEYLAQLKPDSAQITQDDCPICYEKIQAPFKTTCNHVFCVECLKDWLDSANTCPSCRTELYDGKKVFVSDPVIAWAAYSDDAEVPIYTYQGNDA